MNRKRLTARVTAIVIVLSCIGIWKPSLVFARSGQTLVVAFGASQTFGKGVSRNEAYPAQLEAILRAAGHNVRVINAGVNGDTTSGMLARMNSAIPNGTKVVLLQPGGNDRRQGMGADREGNVAEIESRLAARRIQVILMENSTFRSFDRGPDGQHLTAEGYHTLAEQFAPQVENALGQ